MRLQTVSVGLANRIAGLGDARREWNLEPVLRPRRNPEAGKSSDIPGKLAIAGVHKLQAVAFAADSLLGRKALDHDGFEPRGWNRVVHIVCVGFDQHPWPWRVA